MELTGKIIQKLDKQGGSSARGEWKKQEFIIETVEDKFPKKVCITAWADKVDDLERFKINDTVKLSVNIESREYNGRWYTDVRFWKIEAAGAAQNTAGNNEYNQEPPVFENNGNSFGNTEVSDDLPF